MDSCFIIRLLCIKFVWDEKFIPKQRPTAPVQPCYATLSWELDHQ